MEYKDALDNLLEGIGDNYANWNGAMATPDRVNQFRNGLRISSGRKFDKVIYCFLYFVCGLICFALYKPYS